jgi:hypothetical protein
MLLSEFVSSSITQIIDGVLEAQKHALEKGAKINPFGLSIDNPTTKIQQDYSRVEFGQVIEFDVAVTTTEGNQTQGGAGISIASIARIGMDAKTDSSNTHVSRLKFSIPIFLPQQTQD